MILGGGPNRIGQGIEFDYCCCHAAMQLKELGYETIIVNCNPETVSTDYDTSDKLYFEPVTTEDVLQIYEKEKPMGVIVQFGGQTPLNIARELEENGVNVLVTSIDSIDAAKIPEISPKLKKWSGRCSEKYRKCISLWNWRRKSMIRTGFLKTISIPLTSEIIR